MKATATAIHQQLSVIKALFTAFGDRGNMHSRPLTEIQRAINDAPGELGAAVSFFAPAWCNTNVTLEALAETCDSFLATRKQEADIAANPLTTAVLADEWKGASTRFDLLRPAVLWIENTLQGTQLTPAVLLWLVTEEDGLSTSHLRELRAIAITFQDALAAHFAELSRFGTCDYKRLIGTDDSLRNLAAMSRLRLSQLDHFALYARWAIAQKVVNEAGLQKVVDYVVAGSIAPNSCSDFYEFTLYDRLVRMVMDAEPSLRAFARAAHENLRGQFSRMDQEVLRVNALEIQAGLVNKSIPLGNGSGPVAQWTERRLIDNETKKKQRHLPIRQLMLRAGGAVRALKPCFLMSPLSVARYLDPGLPHFDVVLMDEASQIRPEDALGAVARARKVIIVGDPKQLPPTSFYERTADAEQDEEASAAQDSESILDVGLKQFPYRRLRWHYRSQHERLIQFSNASFYDKDLIIVPSPARMRRDAGVYSTFIESSSYNKGRNRGEAEVVVANIIRHYQQHPTLSLGVAAFNLAQADEIQLLLDQARRDSVQIHEIMRPADEGLEELFIKNLENVQGDERDVIFISTTYGPESPGQKVFQRFGPINSDLGWRRLNVIATRAKHRVEVFTCMRPSDILLGGAARRGVEAFRNYLEYAANQPLTQVVRPSGGAPENPFEQSVLDMVTALGYQAVPQVGVAGFFIDIGVLHPDYPGEYVLAIECDGAAYHSARSVRDRDRLRQEILESKGWTIHRIWSTSWFHTRSSEIDRLKRALQEGMKEFLRNRKPHPDQMVVTEVRHMTAAEIKREIDVTHDSLVEALNLYRERNIGEGLSDKPDCILNKNLIGVLVRRRPETNEEWLHAAPLDARLKIDHGQMQHLDGILEIVRDYAI